MKTALVLLLLVVVVAANTVPTKLSYKINEDFNYMLHGDMDLRGQADDNTRGDGTTHGLDSTFCLKVIGILDGDYLLAMNLWRTSQTDPSTKQQMPVLVNSNDNWLGPNCYFTQTPGGQVKKVWYEKGDEPNLIQVKVGAISALQTHIVSIDEEKVHHESDPLGDHYSHFKGTSHPVGLSINKQFSENDVTQFADKNVRKSSVVVNHDATHVIHSDGYIHSATVQNSVVMRAAMTSAAANVAGSSPANNGFENDFSSAGSIKLTLPPFSSTGMVSVNATMTTFNDAVKQQTSLFGVGLRSSDVSSMEAPDIDPVASLKSVVSSNKEGKSMLPIKEMNTLVRYFLIKPQQEMESVLTPVLKEVENVHEARVLFYILQGIGSEDAQELLMLYGMKHSNVEIVQSAIFYAAGFASPSKDLLFALTMLSTHEDEDISAVATMSLGAAIGKIEDEDLLHKARKYYKGEMKRAIENANENAVVALLHSIGNAGPTLFPIKKGSVKILKRVRDSGDIWKSDRVRSALYHGLRKYDGVADILSHAASFDDSDVVRSIAAEVMNEKGLKLTSDIPSGDDFPFNKSYTYEKKWGGSKINCVFDLDLFIGTNFDCKHKYFNYMGLAEAEATLSAFGDSKSAFLAKAIYGKRNGVSVGNELYLRFWNDVLYDKTLPTIDCSLHTKDIAHTAPGFHVSYTIMVWIIPVSFIAGGTLTLDLSWGWEVCDSELLLKVELIPSATFTLSADACVNLLLVQGGIGIDVAFNAKLPPSAYVHGSECLIGLDLEEHNVPMTAEFYAYYKTKHCHWFHCKWGSAHKWDIWSWSMPEHDIVVWKKEWDIPIHL